MILFSCIIYVFFSSPLDSLLFSLQILRSMDQGAHYRQRLNTFLYDIFAGLQPF